MAHPNANPHGLMVAQPSFTSTPVDVFVIKVRLANQYGQEVIHPACDKACKFCEIAGSKTMTRRLVEQVKSLGYRVEVIPTEPKEL